MYWNIVYSISAPFLCDSAAKDIFAVIYLILEISSDENAAFSWQIPSPLCRILYHTFILCSYRASVILYFLTDFSRTNLRTHYCYGIIFHSFTQRSIFKEPKNRFRKELSMTDYSAFIAITNHHLLPPDSDTLDFIPGSVSYHRFLAQQMYPPLYCGKRI